MEIQVIIYSIASVFAALFLFLFIIPLLILPNQLIFKTKIQKTEKIKKLAKRLKKKSRIQTLKSVYSWVISNYSGKEEKYKLANLPELFRYDVDKLINQKRFIACHIQNLVLITLLINTGQFKEQDIERKESITYFLTVHQYLIASTGKDKYKIDPFFRKFKKI